MKAVIRTTYIEVTMTIRFIPSRLGIMNIHEHELTVLNTFGNRYLQRLLVARSVRSWSEDPKIVGSKPTLDKKSFLLYFSRDRKGSR